MSFVDNILRRTRKKGFDVICGDIHDPLAALLRAPGDVRGDDAVFRLEQGVVLFDGLGVDDVESRRGDLSGIECVGHVLLDDQLTSGVIDEDDAVFHLRDRVLVDKPCVFRGEIAVKRDDVCLCKQRVKVRILCDLPARCTLIQIIRQDLHAEGLCNVSFGLADAPEADDADGLVLQLDERIVPEAPVVIRRPAAFVYGPVVMADMVADLEQKRDRELADRRRAVGRDVADGDALFFCIRIVDDIVARGQHRDHFKVRALVYGPLRDRGLVHDHDLRVSDALGDQGRFDVRRAVIDRDLAQRLEPVPAQITGVFRVAVQNNDFHFNNLQLYVQSSSKDHARSKTRLVFVRTICSSSPGRSVTSMEST